MMNQANGHQIDNLKHLYRINTALVFTGACVIFYFRVISSISFSIFNDSSQFQIMPSALQAGTWRKLVGKDVVTRKYHI